jgi:hypothetical protein
MTLYPYILNLGPNLRFWVFDDPSTGLKEEAFVMGMTDMIDRIVAAKKIPNAEKGITLKFCAAPMPDADTVLHWHAPGEMEVKDDQGATYKKLSGNWYFGTVAGEEMQGWLCPALFKYFPAAPKEIYVKAEPLPEGMDPIWHDAPEAEAFVDRDLASGLGEAFPA